MADSSEMAGPSGELIGQLIGEAIAQGNYQKVQDLLNELKTGYANLPDATPVHPSATGPSQLGAVTEDPRYAGSENEVLRQLMALASGGGMSAGDKAKLEQAKQAGMSVSRGLSGAAEDSLRRRGIYDSGASIASQLSGAQAGANTANQGDVATAAASSDRALTALRAGGEYANALGSRDLTQKDMAANANDRINQFNAARTDSADMYNSKLNQENMLAKLKGMGMADAQIAALLTSMAKGSTAKGGGFGRQFGELFGAANKGSGSGSNSGSDPSEWNAYPGTEDSNSYGGYKLGEEDGLQLGSGWDDEFGGFGGEGYA
jgi:hypothetical protein